jgi:hypothetical protein
MRCPEDRPTVHFSKRLVNGHHRTGDIHSPVDRLELLRRQAQGVAHCRTVTSEQLFGCLGGAPLPLPLPLPRRTGRWWSAFNLPTFDSKAPRMVCRSTPQVLARSPLPREGRRVRSARHQLEPTQAALSGCYVQAPGPARKKPFARRFASPRCRRSVTTTTAFVVPPLSGDPECQKLGAGAHVGSCAGEKHPL